MDSKSKLKILEENIYLETPDKSYKAIFEQRYFNLIFIKNQGKINYLHIVEHLSIIETILKEFEKEYPKQKMYFIEYVSDIKGFDLKAINYTLSKLNSWSNYGGSIVVGAPTLLRISILSSKILFNDYIFKFFDKEEDAFKYYNGNLNVEIDKINKKYTRISKNKTWTLTDKNYNDNFYLEFNNPDVFVTKPIGESSLEGVKDAFSQFIGIHQEILGGGMYYRIHDFTNYKISTGRTTYWFIKWVNEHIGDLKLLIFCGLNKKNKTRVNLGKLLFNDSGKIILVDTLADAYSVIEKHRLQNIYSNTINNFDDNFSVPDTKEELKELVSFLIKENKELKETITNSSDKLLKVLSDVSWTTNSSENIDFDSEIPEPFGQLVTAIKIIHNDTQELIRNRDKEHKRSKLLEERYRKIMQIMPKIAIRGYDKDLRIFFWNDASKHIFNVSKEEAIGKKLSEIEICNKCTDPIIDAVNNAVKNKITGEFYPAEQNSLKKNGENIVLFSIHTSLFDVEGDQIFFSMDFDLTKQYQIEAELRNHKENLEQLVKDKTSELEIEKNKAQESDRLKSAFLSNMSHEIRTPMNSIIGFTELLDDSELSAKKRLKYINIIKSSGNNLMNIINDIIDISKIESEQVHIVNRHFNLYEIFSKIEKEFSNEITNFDSIEFIVQDCKYDDIFIHSDSLRVMQIITNFVSNAIKFTHNGTVSLSCKKLSKEIIEISVKDTGIGMSQEQTEYVFNRFRQADESTTRVYGGFGLGLTISQNLAALLNGKIKVKSELGVGSKFILELPIGIEIDKTDNLSIKKEPDIFSTTVNSFSNKLVLIVEDDESSALLLTERLSKLGVNIIHANTGRKAIEFFNSNKHIDMVLLDIQLPDKDGYQVRQEMIQINNKIPIVAQTAFAILNEKEKILNSGFNDYLSKPIQKMELIRVLEQFL